MATFSYGGDLSGQTDGKPIKITQTATAGNTIHTAIAGTSNWHELYVWAYCTHTAAVTLSIEYGDTDTITQTLQNLVGPIWIIPKGTPLHNGQVIKIFASIANVVYVGGWHNIYTA